MEPVYLSVAEEVLSDSGAVRCRPLRPEEDDPVIASASLLAESLREEIVRIGHRLWERQYVEGNGGNISARLGSKYVLCTPTLVSKVDLTTDDICLADLEGNVLVGNRPCTSELLMHLEIYKTNSKARAVVHAHPPHATAFAITGQAPPNGYVSEYEIFVGPAAVAPYETPGTRAFAETVRPFARDHNTILLANHGVVCWSETPTRAEWLVEVLDTCCHTLLIAHQTGRPLIRIPDEKIKEILQLKKRLGLPDVRLDAGEQ